MEHVQNASGNQLNNDLIQKVLAETETISAPAEITAPSETLVNLPGGYITPAGEVIKTAEVRELNGKDEEFIGKAATLSRAFNVILSRATVTLGTESADDAVLDSLLTGDRDSLMLGIYKATFGPEAEIPTFCSGCDEFKFVAINIDRDIKTKFLVDPINDRVFTVKGKNANYLVGLPTGVVQKELSANPDKNIAELTTILLEHCVLEINDSPVIGKAQIQQLGIVDRKKISEEVAKRTPGPQFDDITLSCPDCEREVVVPINLGALFRF
jgi:hypothetical protein